MRNSIFREGGPYNVKKTGADHFTFTISVPPDEYGRVARKCPSDDCSPGYFKIKPGTGIVDGDGTLYCPYCRNSGAPNDFITNEQLRYGKDIMTREAMKGIDGMMKDALGVGSSGRRRFGGGFLSMEVSYKSNPPRPVRRPFEEELQRVVVCPDCGLEQAVFGIAVWCSDCARDIFLTHVAAEYAVLTTILSDVKRRRETLGPRIAAKDIENCLEDAVSIFEAVAKALVVRHLKEGGDSDECIQDFMDKKVRNSFQSIDRTRAVLMEHFQIDLSRYHSEEFLEGLRDTFEKRHPITHNLGVVDRKYIEKALSAEQERREVRVTEAEIEKAIMDFKELLKGLHAELITHPS